MATGTAVTEIYSPYRRFLINETILYCLKECINKKGLSLEIKKKVLTLLYTENATSNRNILSSKTLKNEQENNILGINSKLLNIPPEALTECEKEQLIQYVGEGIESFHERISQLSSQYNLKKCKSKETENLLTHLDNEIVSHVKELEKMKDSELNATELKLRTFGVIEDVADSFNKRLQQVDDRTRCLFQEITKCITSEDREEALIKAEKALEDKIRKNKEEIEEITLKLQLMTNSL